MSNSAATAAPIPVAEPLPEPPDRLLLHMPVDVRSLSQAIVAVLAVLFAMQWAQVVLVPILFGVMTSYALTPIVDQLQRLRIPRAASASLLLIGIALAVGWGAWSLRDQVDALVETLPQVTQKVREVALGQEGSMSTITKVQKAAAEIQAVADSESPAPSDPASASSPTGAGRDTSTRMRAPPLPAAKPAPQPASGPVAATRVIVEKPAIDVRGYLLSGTLGAVALLAQIGVVFFVALFLMTSGDSFRHKMVKLAGPKLSQKKVTVATLDEITGQIQRYLLVQVAVSVLVGVATWLAFYALGMHQSAVWGVVAGVTNLIPYLGAIIVGGGSAVVGMVQFSTVGMGLLVGGVSLAIHTVIGNLLTPWWMGRASRMSPFAVFVAVLVFGWLWGISGLLLGVPVLMAVKAVCDRVDDLKPVGELLGA